MRTSEEKDRDQMKGNMNANETYKAWSYTTEAWSYTTEEWSYTTKAWSYTTKEWSYTTEVWSYTTTRSGRTRLGMFCSISLLLTLMVILL